MTTRAAPRRRLPLTLFLATVLAIAAVAGAGLFLRTAFDVAASELDEAGREFAAVERLRAERERATRKVRSYQVTRDPRFLAEREEAERQFLAVLDTLARSRACDAESRRLVERIREVNGTRRDEADAMLRAFDAGADPAVVADVDARTQRLRDELDGLVGELVDHQADLFARTREREVALGERATVLLFGATIAALVIAGLTARELERALDQLSDEASGVRRRLVAIVGSSPDAILSTDRAGAIQTWNPAAETLFRRPAAEVVGRPVTVLDPTLAAADLGRHITEGVEATVASRVEIAGETLDLAATVAPLRDDGGDVVGAAAIIRDVTPERRLDRELRASLREKDALLREIHHRVKNSLQVVISLLNLKAHQIADPEGRAALLESQGRVRALARVHEILYRSRSLSEIDLGAYLGELVAEIARGHGRAAADLKVEVGGAVTVGPEEALPCGLVVSELVTNALKYAYPADNPGPIRVGVRAVGTNAEVIVADRGAGLPAAITPGETETLGLTLVATLTDQLGGTLAIERAPGTRFILVFPLPDPGGGSADG